MSFELVPGAVIAGRYRLERALGQGGMGVVWAATHLVTRKRVALKFLKGPVHLRPELRRRFLREARAASAVVHPNVLEVHDVFELDDQTPVMLMDLLEGETLGAYVARKGQLTLPETADVLIQVVSAVGTAHAVGVVHRDLKPDNIFLVKAPGAAPSVRVLDFGIAKLVGLEGPTAETGIITGTGSMLGTPCYMSPEQSFGEKAVDFRTDIWSLGVILYECLTGARPVEGDSIGQVVKRLVSDGITPISVALPSLPADATTLIDGMLAREREQRPQDLREVLAVLSRYSPVRAPEFGAATEERPETPASSSSESESESGANGTLASEGGRTRPSDAGPTSRDPAGPETAGAHTMSQAGSARRTPLALWAVTALAVVAGGVAIVSRPTPPTSSASGAPEQMTTARTPEEGVKDPVAPAASPANTAAAAMASPAATLAPSVEAPAVAPSATATPSNRKAAVAAARTPASAHKGTANETPTATAPPSPAPPPAAPRPRVGGLAEKPPF